MQVLCEWYVLSVLSDGALPKRLGLRAESVKEVRFGSPVTVGGRGLGLEVFGEGGGEVSQSELLQVT